jgi:hypothetical protein
MKRRYIVGVREVNVRHYEVMAENEDEAKRFVLERTTEVVDLCHSEYSHELGSDTWSVEEEAKPKPSAS